MCGILGIFGCGSAVTLDNRAVERLRDTMIHRGPDSAGLWRCPWAVLGHRRLEVIAPGPHGRQPMTTVDGRYALVYNGELYNDAELRRALEAEGVHFRTSCDTETVLRALVAWGEAAIGRFRGMFALGFVDAVTGRVILSRDPLGIKPLYAARISTDGGPQVIFASEPTAILAHPAVTPEPDWITVSAYLTTIRPTLGNRTMFAGVETLLPGETRIYDAHAGKELQRLNAWEEERGLLAGVSDPADTGRVIADAVRAHLRTDVPMCALLSGGLDSSVVALLAGEDVGHRLRTYCAGARTDGFDDDFAHAATMSTRLGTSHTEVPVDQTLFTRRWAELVERTGVPVSTPNEIAIYEVARALRVDGHVVTLSGEGADELFGGYAPPMQQAAAWVRAIGGGGGGGREDLQAGLFHLLSNAWVAPGSKSVLLNDMVFGETHADTVLVEEYQRTFAEVAAGAGKGGEGADDSSLQAHLRFHRRMNLPNLLRRLDSTTMLVSVEGRTPFADIRVARFAESLPMASKFVDADPPRTKIALRDAFRGRLPAGVVDRPKASFPLPFQHWLGGEGGTACVRRSAFAREVFRPEALASLATNLGGGSGGAEEAGGMGEGTIWQTAWPVLNIILWGERWWGGGVAGITEAGGCELVA